MRRVDDWLKAYCDFTSYTEAPRRMHFWAGVSAVAGALRRRVWFDQFFFRWYPNFYIIFVAPPGVVNKSTTADTAMSLLREVPGIHFGPDIVTWQALVTSFASACEQFPCNGTFHSQSAITCSASELGNLLNPRDRELIDLLVTLWDGRKGLEKITKKSGNDNLTNPWLNLIGSTTPSWLQENVPPGVVEGGFTSRCIFVYGDRKERLVALPKKHIPPDLEARREILVQTLTHISSLSGEYVLTPDAEIWMETWYQALWEKRDTQEELFGNYIARKQTHLLKLSMVLAAAQRDDLLLHQEDLAVADVMLCDIEADMPKVFSRMGKDPASIQADKLYAFIRSRGGVSFEAAYRYVHAAFPDARDYEGVLAGLIRSGLIEQRQIGATMMLYAKE